MKVLKKTISAKDGSGLVLFRPEIPEDLWHTYNLLQTGDSVRCTTVRKVMKESNTGSTTSSRKRFNVTIMVEKVEFDAEGIQVRLSGRVSSENEYVRLGAYHTLTIELFNNFSIEKDCWDQIYLDRIDEATHPEKQAEIAAIVVQMGLCHVCLVTGALTVTKARIEMNIPKKRSISNAHSKSVTKFYDAIYQAIVRHVDFQKVKCVLLASPGFVKEEVYKYIQQKATQRGTKGDISSSSAANNNNNNNNSTNNNGCATDDPRIFLEGIKTKFVLCKASSGHKFALEEVFSDPNILSQINETKVAKEVDILNQFMRMMDVDPDRAYYGYTHVSSANEQSAIEHLLVSDELFRSSDIRLRKQYVQLVESVRENGGRVYIFSSLHVSGQQLQQVSGVAAILRYPLPDLDQLEQDALELQNQQEHQQQQEQEEEATDEEDHDPLRRMREDVQDMGL